MTFSLSDKRDILIAAVQETMELAETIADPNVRRAYVLEATRISVLLLRVQKEIEDEL